MTKRKVDGTARSWKRAAEMHNHRAVARGVVLGAIQAFVASDDVAMQYQTLGQYRAALLKLIHNASVGETPEPETGV